MRLKSVCWLTLGNGLRQENDRGKGKDDCEEDSGLGHGFLDINAVAALLVCFGAMVVSAFLLQGRLLLYYADSF